jgi:uncharacterized membrane protein
MRKLGFCLVVLGLFSLTACTKSEPGGGTDRAHKFTIEGPMMAASINQGETQTVALKLNRGKEFSQPIKLKADAPKGLDVTVGESVVKPTESGDVNLKVVVAKDASPGEHVIHVTGTPDSGTATSLDVKVKVAERKESVALTLSGPVLATTIKQGETQTIKLTLEPHDKYLADTNLSADAPRGLKTEFVAGSTLKASDKGVANLKVTAEKDAPLGEHTIRVTGKADAATVSAADVKVKVVAP